MKSSAKNSSNLYHEILTPLSVIKMGIDNLEMGFTARLEKDELEIVKVLKQNVNRLERLLNELLAREIL